MIAAQHQRRLALLKRAFDGLRQFFADLRDQRRVGKTLPLRLAAASGSGRGNIGVRDGVEVAEILNEVCPSALSCSVSPETRMADGPMSTPRRCVPISIGTPRRAIDLMLSVMVLFFHRKDAKTQRKNTKSTVTNRAVPVFSMCT